MYEKISINVQANIEEEEEEDLMFTRNVLYLMRQTWKAHHCLTYSTDYNTRKLYCNLYCNFITIPAHQSISVYSHHTTQCNILAIHVSVSGVSLGV